MSITTPMGLPEPWANSLLDSVKLQHTAISVLTITLLFFLVYGAIPGNTWPPSSPNSRFLESTDSPKLLTLLNCPLWIHIWNFEHCFFFTLFLQLYALLGHQRSSDTTYDKGDMEHLDVEKHLLPAVYLSFDFNRNRSKITTHWNTEK